MSRTSYPQPSRTGGCSPRRRRGHRPARLDSGRRLLFEALDGRTMLSAGLPSLLEPLAMDTGGAGRPVAVAATYAHALAIDRLRPIALDALGAGQAQGTIESSGDSDWYTFTATVTGRVAIRQRAGLGSRLDSYLAVYDQQNRLLAWDDDGGEGLNSRVEIDVVAGRSYRLRAGAYGRSTGAYELLVRSDHGATTATATPLTLTRDGAGQQPGDIERAGDADMFRFTAPLSGRMTIRQQAAGGSGLDSFLYVYDSSGRLLGQNDDSGRSLHSCVEIEVTAGQQYFVKAAAYGRSVGTYQLTFRTEGLPADDHGNTLPTATVIRPASTGSGQATGVIERCGDVDLFTFTAPVSGRMTLRQSAASGSALDSYLYVYDRQGRLLGSNDDRAGSLDSLLELDVTAGQQYFVKAAAYGCSRGAYDLRFDTVVTPPLPPSDPTSGYQVDVVATGFTAAQQQILRQASQQWQRVIVGDVPDQYYRGQRVDDVLIEISAQTIDGPGAILGYAQTTDFRRDSGLPFHGVIVIDTADVAAMSSRDLQEVMTHEIGHILGFGVIWDRLGLLTGAGTSNPGFTGAQAVAEYNALFHTHVTAVPVEADGGPGTRLSHWRESVFHTELMTGWHNGGAVNALSRITVASMADLGYQVNLGAANPFAAIVAAPASWLPDYAATTAPGAGLLTGPGAAGGSGAFTPAAQDLAAAPSMPVAAPTCSWAAQVDASLPMLDATATPKDHATAAQAETHPQAGRASLLSAAVDEALAAWPSDCDVLDVGAIL